jgi:hypothetical protein
VAEWARLLSECWVKPVAGSNPVLPATYKIRSVIERILFLEWKWSPKSSLAPCGLNRARAGVRSIPVGPDFGFPTTGVVDSIISLETQLHPEMTSLKSQSFIKAMGVNTSLVRGQLNNVCAALPGAFHCPFHHLAANSLTLQSLIYSY